MKDHSCKCTSVPVYRPVSARFVMSGVCVCPGETSPRNTVPLYSSHQSPFERPSILHPPTISNPKLRLSSCKRRLEAVAETLATPQSSASRCTVLSVMLCRLDRIQFSHSIVKIQEKQSESRKQPNILLTASECSHT